MEIAPRRAAVVLIAAAAFLGSAAVVATELAAGAGDTKLTVKANGSGTITSSDQGVFCGKAVNANDCEEEYDTAAGAPTVKLYARPGEGVSFTGWQGDCQPQADGTCDAVMDQNRDVTGNFSDGSPSPEPSASPSPSPSASASPSPSPSPNPAATPSPTPGPPIRYTLSYSRKQDIGDQDGALRLALEPRQKVSARIDCVLAIGKKKVRCLTLRRKLAKDKRVILLVGFSDSSYNAIRKALRTRSSLKSTVTVQLVAPGSPPAISDRKITIVD